MIRAVLMATALMVACTSSAAAHKASDSYLQLTIYAVGADGRWDIALRDLEQAIGLDGNGDGAITWGELNGRRDAVAAYALPRLALTAQGASCRLQPGAQQVDHHSDGAYVVLWFRAECPAAPVELGITYRLLFDLDPLHRGLVRIAGGEQLHTFMLSPEQPSVTIAVRASPDLPAQLASFAWQGIWHIWHGFDHVLFLISLLLPAVLCRRDGHWQGIGSFRMALLEVAKVVTAFTLAHSLTLTLASLGLIALPARLVESAIAVSVVTAALNNIWPVVDRRLWLFAFGFGLVHGLGFASVLLDLGLPRMPCWCPCSPSISVSSWGSWRSWPSFCRWHSCCARPASIPGSSSRVVPPPSPPSPPCGWWSARWTCRSSSNRRPP